MDKIEVKILNHNFNGTPLFLAKLTQRGHEIKSMEDLLKLYNENVTKEPSKKFMELPHSTIFRMCDMTVAIFGLSTKAVSQLRTHATRLTFMSTSTQYSDFSKVDDAFVIPKDIPDEYVAGYDKAIKDIHFSYAKLCELSGNKDMASYLLPQALRKCLVIHGNFPSLQYMLKLRLCNRNTKEVQYICELILKEIEKECGKVWADMCLPDCVDGQCKEGKFCCGHKYIRS